MKRFFTLFAMVLLWAVTAQATLPTVRISVTTTPSITGTLYIDILNSSGGLIGSGLQIALSSKTPDAGGVLSVVLDATTMTNETIPRAWTALDYNKDYLVRVTFNAVVLSIERMEVVLAKQGLYGAYVDPIEMNQTGDYTFNSVTVVGGSGVNAHQIVMKDETPTTPHTVILEAPNTVTPVSYTLTYPAVAPTDNQILKWNTAGSAYVWSTEIDPVVKAITGMVKSDGTTISAASAGTDYSAGTSALTTGILKSTTGTGVLSIAGSGDFPTLNQNTTGTAANVTGTVAADHGGTNIASYTIGDMIWASAATTLSAVAPNTTASTTKFLSQTADGSSVPGAPVWAVPTVDANNLTGTTLASGVTSSSLTSVGTIATGTWNATTIGTGKGGTGLTTYTTGDIIYASAANTLAKLPAGTDGNILTQASGAPSWQPATNVLKTAKMNWFYMPSVLFNTASLATGAQRDLYELYYEQFTGSDLADDGITPTEVRSSSFVASAGAITPIPVNLTRTDLNYYITYYDTTVFSNVSIDANGIMTYNVISNATASSFINIVFVIK